MPNDPAMMGQAWCLGVIQMRVEPGDPAANLARAADLARRAVESGAGLVLLPEVMDCGWTHPSAREWAGPIPGGASCVALSELARELGVPVCAGLAELDGDRLYNAAVLLGPDGGVLLHHRKIHELDFARKLYAAGDGVRVVDTTFGRLGVMICADAFMPGFKVSRALAGMGAETILSPCAWAVPRGHDPVRTPYGGLWRDSYGPVAREFGITLAGCSNVGPIISGEWEGHRCIGCSLVIGPGGGTLAEGGYGEGAEEIMLVRIPRRRQIPDAALTPISVELPIREPFKEGIMS